MWIFDNPWIIGIGTGIASGVITTWVSRVLFVRKDRGDNLQKILLANKEVIHALRPSIGEAAVPSVGVIRALLAATARRYGVSLSEVYSPTQIAEELIKEVMDSSFISARTKLVYCNQLGTLTKAMTGTEVNKKFSTPETSLAYKERYRKISTAMFSATISILTAMMALLQIEKNSNISTELWSLTLPTLTALIVLFSSYLVLMLTRKGPKATQSHIHMTAYTKR